MSDYVSIGWGLTTLLSAKNFNLMETQFQHAKSHIDLHGHPAIHYTKSESDAKFYPVASGMDADTIDGLDADDLIGNQIPIGSIFLHKGTDDEFSNGYLIADPRWHQCDGSTINDVICPDMRDRFSKCPSTSIGTGVGGAVGLIMTGTITTEDHILTIDEMPIHYHTFIDIYYSGGVYIIYYGGFNNGVSPSHGPVQRISGPNHVGADEAHNHGSSAMVLSSINLTPLWKSFWYICKVS